jgi:hypothetical protein
MRVFSDTLDLCQILKVLVTRLCDNDVETLVLLNLNKFVYFYILHLICQRLELMVDEI